MKYLKVILEIFKNGFEIKSEQYQAAALALKQEYKDYPNSYGFRRYKFSESLAEFYKDISRLDFWTIFEHDKKRD